MSSAPASDLFTPATVLSPPLLALVRVFETQLSEVRFPGVDAEHLAGLVADVTTRQAELASLEERVQARRHELREVAHLLTTQAARALGYARVYADGNPALEAELAGIDFGTEAPGPRRKLGKRSRSELETSAPSVATPEPDVPAPADEGTEPTPHPGHGPAPLRRASRRPMAAL